MKTIVFLCVSICTLLVSFGARAESAFYKCTAKVTTYRTDDTRTVQGKSWEFIARDLESAERIARNAWSKIDDPTKISSIVVENLKCEKPAFSKKKATPKSGYPTPYTPPPPIPTAKTAKPMNRTWTCRVKTRWHVGAKSGDVDETWSDIEAPSESAAMGIAIFRTQSRLKALSLAGTNPTWSRTDVKCS